MLPSVLRAIEACYAPIEDDRAWAQGLLAGLAPLGGEAGIHAVRLERGPKGACEATLLASRAEMLDPFEAWLRDALRTGGGEVLHAGRGRVGLLSRGVAAATRSKARAVLALLRSTGAADVLVIRAEDVRDDAACSALVIAAPSRSPGVISPRALRQLGHFAENLSSALRLRRLLSATSAAGDPAAENPPGEGRLAQAVEREAERVGRPAAPHETEALWEGLANGRWSVVAHLLRADFCVLLLRRAARHDPRALTQREREVLAGVARGLSNKEIGYELKIGSTTVATHLRAAAEKMGHLRRPELIAALGTSVR